MKGKHYRQIGIANVGLSIITVITAMNIGYNCKGDYTRTVCTNSKLQPLLLALVATFLLMAVILTVIGYKKDRKEQEDNW